MAAVRGVVDDPVVFVAVVETQIILKVFRDEFIKFVALLKHNNNVESFRNEIHKALIVVPHFEIPAKDSTPT